MDLKSPCQHCGQNLEFPDNMVGDQINCPHCSQLTVLGAAIAAAPPVLSAAQNPNLTNCPDCGKTVSIRATACPQCGAPLSPTGVAVAAPISAVAPAPAAPPSKSACACPQCHSDNTVKCSVAHASGSSIGMFSALGMDGSGEVGAAGGSTTSQTLLARKLAPPVQERVGCLFWVVSFGPGMLFVLGGLGCFSETVLGGLILLTIGLALCAIPIRKSWEIENKRPDYERELKEWDRAWVCLRCGHIFAP